MASLPLSPPVFSILCALVEERAGLHYKPEDRELFGEKISDHAVAAGFDTLLDYYYFLRYDPAGPAALDALVDALLVNETYFFRELDALESLVTHVLEPRVRAHERPRVWCAASSTGEEPYTLALLLAQRGLQGKVEIIASDLSQRVLEVAKAGVYGKRSLRNMPRDHDATLIEVSGATARVQPALKEAVRFRQVNLVQPSDTAPLGLFDAILCRNVLIYFSDATTRQVVSTLGRALKPTGVLLVGTSESLLRFGTEFNCVEYGKTFFYERSAP